MTVEGRVRASLRPGTALRLVVLLGVLSMLADVTYEGARSITGPFLATLGASGLVVGVVAGFGELAGYLIRLVSGRAATGPGRIWAITLFGYALNLFAVPALALAGNWPAAAALIVLERVGKGARVPPRDAMLSHATQEMGRGWGFGLHEAMDQTGALVGPLLVALVLARHHTDRTAFVLLIVPAVFALAVLLTARAQYPDPRELEVDDPGLDVGAGYPRSFWIYLAGASLTGAGFADFALIAYHFQKSAVVSTDAVPLVYALAMGVSGGAALVLGRLFDRVGLAAVAVAAVVAAAFAPMVFYGDTAVAVAGIVCWGVGMGSQDSIIRAAVATMIPADRRARAYGVFNTGFGLAWFAGSALMGLLYDASRPALVAFSITAQLAAIPFLLDVARRLRRRAADGPPAVVR